MAAHRHLRPWLQRLPLDLVRMTRRTGRAKALAVKAAVGSAAMVVVIVASVVKARAKAVASVAAGAMVAVVKDAAMHAARAVAAKAAGNPVEMLAQRDVQKVNPARQGVKV